MEIGDGCIVGVRSHRHCRTVFAAPLREGRTFPAPLWIEEDEPAPLPGMPPERQAIDASDKPA